MSHRLIFMKNNRFKLFLLYKDYITTALETFTMPVAYFSLTLELDFQPLSTTKICHENMNCSKGSYYAKSTFKCCLDINVC